ncbi:MAG: crosslink repair DNA glycosylase YcaQ family protein [Bacteroidota bacterium]
MKSKPAVISLEQARLLALASQGLAGPKRKGKQGALAVIEHLGYVQIDTLSVAARAHHHVLWSRTSGYREKHLDELMEKDKSVFEYWSHAAACLPMKDFRFSLHKKQSYLNGKSHWFRQDKRVKRYVLDRIRSEGPLQSRDFENPGGRSGEWYTWKPAKRALEQLFLEGVLMVSRRQGFQKVYDLAERVLPAGTDTRPPSDAEFAEYLIRKKIRAHGLVSEKEISYLRKGVQGMVGKELRRMLADNTLVSLKLKTDPETVYYSTADKLAGMDRLRADTRVRLLSPFDNLLIQRKRTRQLFGFDFTIECYLPEHKRKYGYFCLPVLYDGRFAARLDPRADRQKGVFYVKKLFFEPAFIPDAGFMELFAEELKAYAAFTGCGRVQVVHAQPHRYLQALRQLLNDRS